MYTVLKTVSTYVYCTVHDENMLVVKILLYSIKGLYYIRLDICTVFRGTRTRCIENDLVASESRVPCRSNVFAALAVALR